MAPTTRSADAPTEGAVGQTANSSTTNAIKLPKFWKSNATLWFVLAEAQFIQHGIETESAKSFIVIAEKDQGRQFESTLFRELTKLLGCERIRTTHYHPCSNGMVERFHRTLKSAIMCHNTQKWMDVLPTVLLGIRTSLKSDVESTPSEMVYGLSIKVPGEFLQPSRQEIPTNEFVLQLKTDMENLQPKNTKYNSKETVFVHKDLQNSKFVFVRKDGVRKSLQPPYEGPFQVLNRTPKHMTIKFNLTTKTVSLDRVKPAYVSVDDNTD
ncbi:uncharacterized protein LOC142228630 [Haematobia irritans]|uniref:uncharacterized protein LOC142228630 n=1 Tax=Haematobia irritans TaxID=7368 RepID=UPI003F502E8D